MEKKKYRMIIVSLVLILALVIAVFSILYYLIINKENNTSLYSKKATMVINNNNYTDINDKEYSKVVEVMLENNLYNNDYLDTYLNINYVDNDIFINNLNNLIEKKYTSKEINDIYKYLSKENIQIVINNDYMDLKDYYNISNLDLNNYQRYIDYLSKNKYDLKDVVTRVNMNLDLEGYSVYKDVTDTDNLLLIVNKYNKLSDDYEPSDLVALSSKYNHGANNMVRKVVSEAFMQMCDAALVDDIVIYNLSAYRSFSTQSNIYNRSVETNGLENANKYSAKPGFSEHQTGLALDVNNISSAFANTNTYTWLINNSYKYGFILRYPKDKEDITGYNYEPWHYRYVGVDVATKIYEQDITYEEYYENNLK